VGCWLGMKAVTEPIEAGRAAGSIVKHLLDRGVHRGGRPVRLHREQVRHPRHDQGGGGAKLAGFGIRVNSVHPGGGADPDGRRLRGVPRLGRGGPRPFLKAMPLGRFAEPAEISRLVAYLASDDLVLLDRERIRRRRRPAVGPGLLKGEKGRNGRSAGDRRPGSHRDRGGKTGSAGPSRWPWPGAGGAAGCSTTCPGTRCRRWADQIAADGGAGGGGRRGRRGSGRRARSCWPRPLEQYGRLDIVVNNAGVLRGPDGVHHVAGGMGPWSSGCTCAGHFVTTRLATAYWRGAAERGLPPGVYARIVNTSSEAFLLGSLGQPNYARGQGPASPALNRHDPRAAARGTASRAQRDLPPAAPHRHDRRADGPRRRADAVDPLAPEARRAAGGVPGPARAAETINGEVFVVHGGGGRGDGPRRGYVRCSGLRGTPDGMWTLDSVAGRRLGPAFWRPGAPRSGFLCEDTIRAGLRDHRVP